MTRLRGGRAAVLALAVVTTIWIAGCGGGGGSAPNPNAYVIAGQVRDVDYMSSSSGGAIRGAVVTIGTQSTGTDSSGNFRLEFDSPPIVGTWSANGSNATPAPGYYDYWAKLGIVTTTFDARALPMPGITERLTIMPTVYLMSRNYPPPF